MYIEHITVTSLKKKRRWFNLLTTPFDLTLAMRQKTWCLARCKDWLNSGIASKMARAGGCRNYRGLAPRDESWKPRIHTDFSKACKIWRFGGWKIKRGFLERLLWTIRKEYKPVLNLDEALSACGNGCPVRPLEFWPSLLCSCTPYMFGATALIILNNKELKIRQWHRRYKG